MIAVIDKLSPISNKKLHETANIVNIDNIDSRETEATDSKQFTEEQQ